MEGGRTAPAAGQLSWWAMSWRPGVLCMVCILRMGGGVLEAAEEVALVVLSVLFWLAGRPPDAEGATDLHAHAVLLQLSPPCCNRPHLRRTL